MISAGALFVTLVSTVGEGVVSHLTGKAIDKLGPMVFSMISAGMTADQIAEKLDEEGLSEEVETAFREILSQTILVPSELSVGRSPSQIPKLMVRVVEYLEDIARAWKVDLILAGSFIGPNYITIFNVREKPIAPNVVRSAAKWSDSIAAYSSISIVPDIPVDRGNSPWTGSGKDDQSSLHELLLTQLKTKVLNADSDRHIRIDLRDHLYADSAFMINSNGIPQNTGICCCCSNGASD